MAVKSIRSFQNFEQPSIFSLSGRDHSPPITRDLSLVDDGVFRVMKGCSSGRDRCGSQCRQLCRDQLARHSLAGVAGRGRGREGRRPDGDQRSRLLGNYLFSVCVFRASASLMVASRSSLLLCSQLHHFYNVYLKMLVVCTILLLNICHSDSC